MYRRRRRRSNRRRRRRRRCRPRRRRRVGLSGCSPGRGLPYILIPPGRPAGAARAPECCACVCVCTGACVRVCCLTLRDIDSRARRIPVCPRYYYIIFLLPICIIL